MIKNDRKAEASVRKTKAARFSWFQDERNQRYLLALLLALVLTVIIVPKGGFVPDNYEPGDIVSRDIKSPKELLVSDLPLTEKKQREAEESVLPLYDFDSRAGQAMADQVAAAAALILQAQSGGTPPEQLAAELELQLGVGLDEQLLAALQTQLGAAGNAEAGAAPEVAALRNAVLAALRGKIVGNLQLFEAERKRGITIRNLETRQEADVLELNDVISVGDVRDRLREQFAKLPHFPSRYEAVLFPLATRLIQPNLTFNRDETEARKSLARDGVKPVLFQIKKGEMIVREGERITPEQIKKLRAFHEPGSHYSTLSTAFGLFLTLFLLLFTTHRFARNNVRKYRPNNRDLFFLTLNFVGLFVLIKVGIFISTALESAFPYIESTSYYYLFPLAAGAMLARIVLNSEVAFVFALLSAVFTGILFGNSLTISIYALVGSVTAAHWVRQCKQRTTLYRAGFRLSLVNMLMILGLYLMNGRFLDMQLLYILGFGAGGGFLCALIVTGTIPLVEYLFKYTTDIKLLELANMNTPVLRELMIQAPGTYHHSVIVSNLVEAAAESINANPLLARVAAYYHDVGKIRKPLYFIENIHGQENKHDKLAPSMSALILMSHVKDAVELARENHLGEPLIDIIRQHHGTALIKFFYDRAKAKADPGMQQINERDYRYPGPKPQTREAALIMLADAVEAASRTLSDPTPARIQGMVQKIINNIFIDGQLDECELTLKDLHQIAKCFNRILAGIFHHRVDYPEPAYTERDKEAGKRKNGENSDREPSKETKSKETAPAKGSTEDLKRLGMS
ncbi:MAG: HDIG domain-containing protein [Desulfuromonadaceae bacterium]